MQTATKEAPYLPEDEWLPHYEGAVRQIALRRLVQMLFRARQPMKIAELLSDLNISINSLAAAFEELNEVGAVQMVNGEVSLTDSGRRVLLRNRRKLFLPRVVVHYRKPNSNGPDPRNKSNTFSGGGLPDVYRLSELDIKHNTN